ncbi:helix-turn-helix domain-containing protein [Furfurilactobacillus siliginis]|uniref:HTH cro/C1-type domain-containing protein n=1 Tax=Furfurilactobacillus siliginis TaxID=348151 RepID=A0A0R2LA81_9LACO|nr:helix-turn-helix transcriptional regulator [Furfurilactobacillus siliginis]KRN96042.1 hypothetical protein IV55_GL001723 [Furfurilactobacillus siliginis]GEK29268.1 hypothetical protein LSI01_15790 [Furfurilactobacillus siliginis]
MTNLSELLKQARVDRKLSMASLSENIESKYHVRLSTSMITRYEQGHNIPLKNLFVLANYLEIDLNQCEQDYIRRLKK